ncbi:hypothetical protein [Hirschia maritima]|uniref:hypothetical protein n=1 Tax=Hirschia maritima TaxID=1121961 RepID=UPI0003766FF2|nr:hypothetical protein [Hirschia maritima]
MKFFLGLPLLLALALATSEAQASPTPDPCELDHLQLIGPFPNDIEIQNVSYLWTAVDGNLHKILHLGPKSLNQKAAEFYLNTEPTNRDTLSQISMMNWVANIAIAHEMDILNSRSKNHENEKKFYLPVDTLNQILQELKYGFFHELSTRDPPWVIETHRLNFCTAATILGTINEISIPEILIAECKKRLHSAALSLLTSAQHPMVSTYHPDWSSICTTYGYRMRSIVFLKLLAQRIDDTRIASLHGKEPAILPYNLQFREPFHYRIEHGKFMKSLFMKMKSELYQVISEKSDSEHLKQQYAEKASYYSWLSQIN